MSGYRKCAVWGCTDKDSTRHKFPEPNKYTRIFEKWLIACCNQELLELTYEEIHKLKKICHIHFKTSDIYSNKVLKKEAVPSLNLPGAQLVACPDCSDAFEQKSPDDSAVKHRSLPGPVFMSPIFDELLCNSELTNNSSSILKRVGVKKVKNVSPEEIILYKKCQRLKRSLKRLKNKSKDLKTRIQHCTPDEILENSLMSLQKPVANFVRSQLRPVGRHSKGHHFTTDDKVLGLVLYKQSGRAYRTLSKLFCLPSRKILLPLLNRIPIGAGINESIFRNLKLNASFLKSNEKLCILMFDEMAIKPHVDLNIKEGHFEGFEDLGDVTSSKIADHAQTFLIKGIATDWQQPIAYSFCSGTTKTLDLVRIIKDVIRKCREAGLKVVATVCDQGSTNQAAINYLMKRSVENYSEYIGQKFFKIDGETIIHIYDPPHLLKGIRNNLLGRNLIWECENGPLTAKWSHIYTAYKIDTVSTELRTMPKLTEGHCNPEKIQKKKVSYATQVFSHTVASTINLFARSGIEGPDGVALDMSAVGTAKILKLFDDLFDSCNGHTLYPKGGKQLRCAVSEKSPHIQFWNSMKQNLKNMYFQGKGSEEKFVPATLKNWIVTINGFQNLHIILKNEGISFLKTRVCSQDPLENFFRQLQQQGSRKVNPTAAHFKTHFKTLLINNFVTRHSLSSVCAEKNSPILSLRNFVTQGISKDGDTNIEIPELTVPEKVYTSIDMFSIGCVGGFLAKKAFKCLYQCTTCKKNLLCDDRSKWHMFTQEEEYAYMATDVPSRLKYCSPELIKGLCTTYNILRYVLPLLVSRPHAYEIMLKLIFHLVKFNFKDNTCRHDLNFLILPKFIFLVSTNWVKGINRIISGRDGRYHSGYDKVMEEAKTYYLERRKKRRNK